MRLINFPENSFFAVETMANSHVNLYCEEGMFRKRALRGSKSQMAFLKKRPKWSLLPKEEEIGCVGWLYHEPTV